MKKRNKQLLHVLTFALAIQLPFQCAAEYSRYWYIIGEKLGARDVRLERPQSYEDVLSPKLAPEYRDYLTLLLFAQADHAPTVADKKRFVSQYTWRDLELFPHLFDSLNRTTTVFGRATLSGILTDPVPVTDINELHRRQEIIKLLRKDAGLRKSLQFLLKRVCAAEEILLLFHLDDTSNRRSFLRQYYTERRFNFGDEGFMDTFHDWVDSSPSMNFMTGTSARLVKVLQFTLMIDSLYLGKSLIYDTVRDYFFPNCEGALKNKMRAQWRQDYAAAQNQFDQAKMATGVAGLAEVGGRKIVDGLSMVGSMVKKMQDLAFLPFAPFEYYQDMKMLIGVHRVLHGDLIKLASAVNSLRMVSRSVRRLDIEKIVPECKDLFSLLEMPGQAPDFKKLLDILDTDTFKGQASSWSLFSHYGRMFAANHLMEKTKVVWARLFQAIGYLDAYLSIATLMDEYEEKGVRFCYPEYVAENEPLLELRGFWNPVITLNEAYRDTSMNNVITNDLTFGQKEKNIMLTGPNAGGKSTIVRAAGHCVFLAQTLGIAPAESMRLTPFTMINTAMNLRDSQAEGLSGFKTELNTACKYLMGKVDRLEPHELVLNLFDELFRATSQHDAQNTLYRFAKKFSKPNMLTVYATHNHGDLIVGLEKEQPGIFTNYCVEAPDGEHPDFKLKRGFSRQSVVKKLWQEFGLDDSQLSTSPAA